MPKDSSGYYHPTVVARNNPLSLELPVSSSRLDVGTPAISSSIRSHGRYRLRSSVPFHFKFVTQGVDSHATDSDPVQSANESEYYLVGSANGISVLVSGSTSGSLHVTEMAGG